MNYEVEPWGRTFQVNTHPFWKSAIYKVANPFFSLRASQFLSKEYRERLKPEMVLAGRGISKVPMLRWATKGRNLSDATLLIQGTGTGWDAAVWARLSPRKIIATDLFAFDSWEEVARHCRDRHSVTVEFKQAPLEDHAFLDSGSIDICSSFAVLEHCRNLGEVLKESRRVLRGGGLFYADYGPLWNSPGGDHLTPPDDDCYPHILLSEADYRRYVESHPTEGAKGFQSGRRYYELDLFSRLTTDQYLEAFQKASLECFGLVLEISPVFIQFQKRFPEKWKELVRGCPNLKLEDLMIKSNYVRAAAV